MSTSPPEPTRRLGPGVRGGCLWGGGVALVLLGFLVWFFEVLDLLF